MRDTLAERATEQNTSLQAYLLGLVRYALMAREPWLLDLVWTYRHDVSLDDAPYVALALRYDVPLVTSDQRLARAARALGAAVTAPVP